MKKTLLILVPLILIAGSREASAQLAASADEIRCLQSAPGARYMRGAACPACVCPIGYRNSMASGGRKGDVCEQIPTRTPPAPVVRKAATPKPAALTFTVTPQHSAGAPGEAVHKMLTAPGPAAGKIVQVVVTCDNGCVTDQGTLNVDAPPQGGRPFTMPVTLRPKDPKAGGPAKATVQVFTSDGQTKQVDTTVQWAPEPAPPPPPPPAPKRTRCEDTGGTNLPNGCLCPSDKVEKRDPVTGEAYCAEKPKTACEQSAPGAKISPDGTDCLCPEPLVETKLEGREKEPGICTPPAGAPGTPGKDADSRFHLLTELKLSYFGSEHFKSGGNGYLAIGPSFDLSSTFQWYAQVGIGVPGTPVHDKNGQPIRNADGTVLKRNVSGIVEGGIKAWFNDMVGLRLGVVYLPFGLSNGIKFTHAGLGAVAGLDLRFVLNEHAAFIVGPSLVAGAHMQDGKQPEFGYGAMLNIGLEFFNQRKPVRK